MEPVIAQEKKKVGPGWALAVVLAFLGPSVNAAGNAGLDLRAIGMEAANSPQMVVVHDRDHGRVVHFFRAGETISHHAEIIQKGEGQKTQPSVRRNGGGRAMHSQSGEVTPYNGSINTVAYRNLIREAAQAHNIPQSLLRAVIHSESSFQPYVESHAGAVGLMQLMPATARRFGVTDRRDPAQNVQGGAAYLRELLDRYGGNLDLALAGYNAGEGAVDRYGGIPPFDETQTFVQRVKSRHARYHLEQNSNRIAEGRHAAY
ncbi:lytic transglycosylase domain-containing protein [Thioalkalivibrio sp. ALE23]|uniref:lytic transglycosylase domain-containing protein n=1 Tax=Thioalkalivibrio sp. ALE23 TaxID=1265495 RepID=UPI00037F4C72|nr:lytic transglycosylase domain-containing protein [Thioalkalivibrio sp. ALE23]